MVVSHLYILHITYVQIKLECAFRYLNKLLGNLRDTEDIFEVFTMFVRLSVCLFFPLNYENNPFIFYCNLFLHDMTFGGCAATINL
jgi:hypothetical protein